MEGRLKHRGTGKRSGEEPRAGTPLFLAPLILAILLLALLTGGGAEAGVMAISRVSTSSSGGEGDGSSTIPAISADGRYVAFASGASNLTASDGDATYDVFRKDTQTGEIVLISQSTLGAKGDGNSSSPVISGDGRFVAFWSYATNLSSSDPDFAADIFVRDVQAGATRLVSTSTDGGVKGNSNSYFPSISRDGRYIAFESEANNLVAGDNNNETDIFLKDTQTHITTRISITSAGAQVVDDSYRPAISADGSRVAFWSQSGMGTGDADNAGDIFIKRLSNGEVTLASTSSAGVKGNGASYDPSLSEDGRYVAFESSANNLAANDTNVVRDVFLKDTQTGATTRISTTSSGGQGASASYDPQVSSSGRYVAFESMTSNLGKDDEGNGNMDIFVKDTFTGATELISQGPRGALSGGENRNAAISGDGRYVAFESGGDNLAPGDSNTADDVFINHSGPRLGFTWYDDLYAQNWVLFANPAGASSDAWFDLSLAGVNRPMPWLAGYGQGQVPAGGSLFARYGGIMGGPVDAGYHARGGALASQRVLWAGNSLEEVVGTDTRRLSDHYFWTWYDEFSPGFKNWVMVANPSASPVYYRILVKNISRDSGQIAPGGTVTAHFPVLKGGPVEVRAWSDALDGQAPAQVLASQRVLSAYDTAFNEVVGIPEEELSSSYYWTWYDSESPGAQNWVMIAKLPGGPPIYYEVRFSRQGQDDLVVSGGPLVVAEPEQLTFPGSSGGPVEVRTFQDADHQVPAESIVSQRVLWGASFEEMPGTPGTALDSVYDWTWYDMASPGAQNWLMIANPRGAPLITYSVSIAGEQVASSFLVGGQSHQLQWPGTMDGPVRVVTFRNFPNQPAPSPAIVSQRVLWNGFFNEVAGTPP